MLEKLKAKIFKEKGTILDSFIDIRNHIEEIHVQKNRLETLIDEKKDQLSEIKTRLRELVKL